MQNAESLPGLRTRKALDGRRVRERISRGDVEGILVNPNGMSVSHAFRQARTRARAEARNFMD